MNDDPLWSRPTLASLVREDHDPIGAPAQHQYKQSLSVSSSPVSPHVPQDSPPEVGKKSRRSFVLTAEHASAAPVDRSSVASLRQNSTPPPTQLGSLAYPTSSPPPAIAPPAPPSTSSSITSLNNQLAHSVQRSSASSVSSITSQSSFLKHQLEQKARNSIPRRDQDIPPIVTQSQTTSKPHNHSFQQQQREKNRTSRPSADSYSASVHHKDTTAVHAPTRPRPNSQGPPFDPEQRLSDPFQRSSARKSEFQFSPRIDPSATRSKSSKVSNARNENISPKSKSFRDNVLPLRESSLNKAGLQTSPNQGFPMDAWTPTKDSHVYDKQSQKATTSRSDYNSSTTDRTIEPKPTSHKFLSINTQTKTTSKSLPIESKQPINPSLGRISESNINASSSYGRLSSPSSANGDSRSASGTSLTSVTEGATLESPANAHNSPRPRLNSLSLSSKQLSSGAASSVFQALDRSARFFRDPDTTLKLEFMTQSEEKFEDVLANGFPAYINSKDNKDTWSLTSLVPREMTLKLTLTPSSMRADEDIIYGWYSNSNDINQHSHAIGSALRKAAASPTQIFGTQTNLPAVANERSDSVSSDTGPGGSYSDSGVNQTELDHRSEEIESGIPPGGLGGGQPSRRIVQRVIGKWRKPKTAATSIMITSSDMEAASSENEVR